MHTTRSAVVAASLTLLGALLVPALAQSSVSAPLAQQRITTFAKRTDSLQRQVDVLRRRVAQSSRRAGLSRPVVCASERVIRLNRRVVDLNRLTLSSSITDQTTLTSLLSLDTQLVKLDRATLAAQRQICVRRSSPLGARVVRLGAHVKKLRTWVRSWWQTVAPVPDPTPTPAPSDTPTPADSPTPAPSDTPTATPTATPTPTPSPTAPVGGTVISDKTYASASGVAYTVPSGQHDVTYQGCSFTSTAPASAQAAALSFNQTPAYDITFSDCTFQSSHWNDVSLWSNNQGNVHDITFSDCTFLSSGRMGIETGVWPETNSGRGYWDITLSGCTFQPMAEEALSFGGWAPKADLLISDCTVLGSDNSADSQFSGELEIGSATYCTVTGCTFYAGRENCLNLDPMSSVGDCHNTFTNDVLDYSVRQQSLGTDSSYARLTELQNVQGAVFDGCTFNCGSTANHAYNAGYWTNSSGNTFTDCTVTGRTSTAVQPTTGAGYFSLDSACTNNILPAKQ